MPLKSFAGILTPDREVRGGLQEEVARRAGLHRMECVELDHTCGEILKFLHREGLAERLDGKGQEAKKKEWRLSKP